MNPASGEYVFGLPLIKDATIQLPNKKTLHIKVTGNKADNQKGIQSIQFNHQTIPVKSISHQQLLKGGLLEIQLN
jgi:putative alpha-1,2-mannosidase